MGGQQEQSKCAKCPIVIKILSITSALVLVGFGIAGLIMQTINNLSSGKFFLLFSPIFMILVGLLFLSAEFKINFLMKHFSYLKSYLGRGIFNLFMASTVYYFFSCSNNNDLVGWIAAILIFLLGIIFIGVHFCGGDGFKSKQDTSKGMKEQLQ